MKKILMVFGTRPEAIKMMPIIKELEKSTFFKTSICVTSQHNELLKEVLVLFNINPHFDLNVMKPNQTLFGVTNSILYEIDKVYDKVKPDLVLVHGDTTTAFVAALAAFYKKIDVGHIEAGLRTNDIYSPYPEEFNRQAISLIAKYHFAPTENNRNNLIKSGINPNNIFVTGNTAIDVFKYTLNKDFKDEVLDWLGDCKLIILTAHRREIFGQKIEAIFSRINDFLKSKNGYKLLFPVHPNPAVKQIANQIFKDNKKVLLIEPLNIVRFHNLIAKSHLIITDSGGIQEEAPSLNVPVVVIRDVTERQEAIEAGTVILAGTNPDNIIELCNKILSDENLYSSFKRRINPYGDGTASIKIINELEKIYFKNLNN